MKSARYALPINEQGAQLSKVDVEAATDIMADLKPLLYCIRD